ASMAALVFEQDIVDDCDPTMRDLIRWHALEEIEHKHVAYDVYARMHPYNYPLRILGFLLASVVIMGFTGRGMRMLLSADALAGRITREQFAAARREMREGKALAFRKAMLPALLKYFVPGFHPNQQDDSALLARVAPEIALTTSTR
ncbi:MAG TPA: metal-dependent hydrolase, partial [Polyangiales bacterium]|nr:metal-dependent hydrolase [Polyangiales bacterium]